jgi:hypothetical protein
MTHPSDPIAPRPTGTELRRTIKGCDASWTMTISVGPLEPDDGDEPSADADAPALPADSLLILDRMFRNAVDLYEYRRIAEHT